MIIEYAERFGLAQLHQLRGRVGRYKHRAYCYLLLDPHQKLNPTAAKQDIAIRRSLLSGLMGLSSRLRQCVAKGRLPDGGFGSSHKAL